ncbi:hypothetical protein NPIL_444001 [Nephila pilipes]|uniref:Uncharacterized protein n=1 Tax=Nephila pilipes TaxID=299642 RepID=A0A8X6T4D2_NEPPI|nr:hypothetical protein NPIL_444001 [Nephila pilipes]
MPGNPLTTDARLFFKYASRWQKGKEGGRVDGIYSETDFARGGEGKVSSFYSPNPCVEVPFTSRAWTPILRMSLIQRSSLMT